MLFSLNEIAMPNRNMPAPRRDQSFRFLVYMECRLCAGRDCVSTWGMLSCQHEAQRGHDDKVGQQVHRDDPHIVQVQPVGENGEEGDVSRYSKRDRQLDEPSNVQNLHTSFNFYRNNPTDGCVTFLRERQSSMSPPFWKNCTRHTKISKVFPKDAYVGSSRERDSSISPGTAIRAFLR